MFVTSESEYDMIASGPASGVTSAAATTTKATADVSEDSQNEEELRNQLRQALESIKKREPIDPSYKSLLMSGAVTSRRPVIPKDKFYKPIGSRLRERVEKFMVMTQGKDPFDRILQRQPLEQGAMRAAFTLREAKDHEQTKMLAATMASLPRRNGMDDQTRKRHLESIATGLQSRGGKKKKPSNSPPPTALEQTELARQKAELERQRAAAREREEARKRREEQDRRRREEEIVRQRNKVETPQQAMQKIIQPVFKVLWDMEFDNLGGSNPFRIVIDKENYIAMQVPDYFDVSCDDAPDHFSWRWTLINFVFSLFLSWYVLLGDWNANEFDLYAGQN